MNAFLAMYSKLYLVENSGGWIESPIAAKELRKTDKVIAEFNSDMFYTAEEQFDRFNEYVREQTGKVYCEHSAAQLKELHKMWQETLQKS